MKKKIEYIDYAEGDIVENPNIAKMKIGNQQYGNKLYTPNSLNINGKLYPIYAICWGNSASCYIIKNGKKLFVRDYPTL